jgi:WD40 repeat protein
MRLTASTLVLLASCGLLAHSFQALPQPVSCSSTCAPDAGQAPEVLPSGQPKPDVLYAPFIAFSPDSKSYVTALREELPTLYSVKTNKALTRYALAEKWLVSNARFCPDGKALALIWAVSGMPIWFLDAATGNKLCVADDCPWGHVPCAEFSPDGTVLAAAFEDEERKTRKWSRAIYFWEASSGRKLPKALPLKARCSALAFSVDSKFLAVEHTVLLNEEEFGGHPRTHGVVSQFKTWLELWQIDQPDKAWLIGTAVEDGYGKPYSSLLASDIDTNGTFRIRFSPTGKPLIFPAPRLEDAAIKGHRTVSVFDALSGNELLQYTEGAPERPPFLYSFFSPDRNTLAVVASGSLGSHVLTWNLTKARDEKRAKIGDRSAAQWEALWQALGEQGPPGHRALGALFATPRQTCAFLKTRIKAVPRSNPNPWPQLLADLNDAKYSVREQTQREWEKMGAAGLPVLAAALKKQGLTLEQRARLERVLDKLKDLDRPLDLLRPLQVIDLLERFDMRDARQILQTLADGEPAAWLTAEAKASLDRLDRR